MSEEILTFASMKADRARWDEDHRRWRAEICEWQRQHDQAVRDLDRIQELLRDHGRAIATIEQTMRDHERSMQSHLEAMTAFEQGRGDARLNEELAGAHREHASRHGRQAEAQERIRRHHAAVVEQVARLEKALLEAV